MNRNSIGITRYPGRPGKRALHVLARAGLLGILLSLLVPETTWSHHSFAMYDRTKSATLTGKLIRFIPGANHAQLLFELMDSGGEIVLDEEGAPVIWGIETGPSALIAKQGITVRNFPVGTILTVTINPLRDGRTFGAHDRSAPIINCGMEFPEAGCTVETGTSHFDRR